MGDVWCAIHQPNLFPRLSTLAKIYAADIWIVLDDVQFARRDYQHRFRIAPPGDPEAQRWLTLPVHLPDGRATRINDVRIAGDAASVRKRMLRMIKHYYQRTPHWNTLSPAILETVAALGRGQHAAYVAELSTLIVLRQLGWQGHHLRSSTMPGPDARSERLARLTAACGAGTYLCGTGGARYLDTRPFIPLGLQISYFTPPQPDPGQGIWSESRRLSVLWALMTFGPGVLRCALGGLRSLSVDPAGGQVHHEAEQYQCAKRGEHPRTDRVATRLPSGQPDH